MIKIGKIPVPGCGFYLRSIYFYLTEGCNLNCRHCWINPSHEKSNKRKYPYLALSVFKDVIQQGKELGLRSVKLTGGEPLLHPKIKEILFALKGENVLLIIESNGIPCSDKSIVKAITKYRNTFFAVSLDSIGNFFFLRLNCQFFIALVYYLM